MMNAAIQLERINDMVMRVVFDQPGSSANVFDLQALESLSVIVDEIDRDAACQGVIFVSHKPSIFIAGADVKQLSSLSPEALRGMITLGQSVFCRIAALRCVTVAAIHGACLGGGFELCLACDYRVGSDDSKTRIGLPETQLGILPAWGGTSRLPQLIGLSRAAAAILEGKTFSARRAKSLGMLDAVVPYESLEAGALKLMNTGKPIRSRHFKENNRLMAAWVHHKAGQKLDAKTHGNYPAPRAALDVLVKSVRGSLDDSLRREEHAALELAQTPVCRHLMNIFFMREAARKKTLPGIELNGYSSGLPRCAVVGAGVMGAGIAQWLSAKGHSVVLKDIAEDPLRKGMGTIGALYQDGIKRHQFDRVHAREGLDRILPTLSFDSMKRVDLVIEAAVERMDLKKAIFSELADVVGPQTILATNTSALSITALAKHVANPQRVVGLHFFNPVGRMPLVEVVRGTQTQDDVVLAVIRFVQQIGKLPVVVNDSPGFLVNRILMPYLVEAGLLLEAGVTVSEIDAAMLAFGMPMGPLRLIDEIGVDVALHVARTLAESFSGRLPVPAVLTRMVDAGCLGVKTGSGFYLYKEGKDPIPNEALRTQLGLEGQVRLDVCSVADRLALTMINEAAMCLEAGVVETPGDLDFGMIMGTGFAPFRGGPMRLADAMGITHCVEVLRRLAAAEDERFSPCAHLVNMSNGHKTFYEES